MVVETVVWVVSCGGGGVDWVLLGSGTGFVSVY